MSIKELSMISLPKKAIAFALAAFFLLSCQFCALECAFASAEHHHGESPHEVSRRHHSSESQKDKDSEKHDENSLCCSDLVAVISTPSNTFDAQLLKSHLANDTVFSVSSLYPGIDAHTEYQIVFPSGASPPTFFLLAHTAHAPPVAP